MSDSDIQRIFEKLDGVSQRLSRIEANQESAKERDADTADKLDRLRMGDCPMGLEHGRRIEALESRPERMVAVISSIVAIGAAAIAWIKGHA